MIIPVALKASFWKMKAHPASLPDIPQGYQEQLLLFMIGFKDPKFHTYNLVNS